MAKEFLNGFFDRDGKFQDGKPQTEKPKSVLGSSELSAYTKQFKATTEDASDAMKSFFDIGMLIKLRERYGSTSSGSATELEETLKACQELLKWLCYVMNRNERKGITNEVEAHERAGVNLLRKIAELKTKIAYEHNTEDVMEITKRQFRFYESVREAGYTNMMDTEKVMDLTGLNQAEILFIRQNYLELKNRK